jgi:hypothetical protein
MFYPALGQKGTSQFPYALLPLKVRHGEVVKDVFLNASLTYNSFFNFQRSGKLDLSFPYTTYNSKGTTNNVFSGTTSNAFARRLSQFEFDLQGGSRQHYVDVNVGVTNVNTYWWSLGYGHTFFAIGAFPKTIYIKTSLSIVRYTFPVNMGSFQAKDAQIDVMGKTLDSTYTYYVGKSTPKTAIVDHVNVRYTEKTWSLQPKVSVEWHPFKTKLFVEGTIAYSLPFAEQSRVWLERAADGIGVEDGATTFGLKSPGLTTLYNGVPVTSSPFNLRAVQFGIRVGLTFHEFRVKRS